MLESILLKVEVSNQQESVGVGEKEHKNNNAFIQKQNAFLSCL
jgi:hypothetical protein